MVRRALFVAMAVALSFAAGPAAAGDPQITDIAGDANFVSGFTPTGDTRPASYDPGDLVSVKFETAYVEVPVGADGIHYEPTGVAWRFRTLASPDTTTLTMDLRILFDVGGCLSEFDAYLHGDLPDGQDFRDKVVEWWQLQGACPDESYPPLTNPNWKVTIDPDAGELAVSLPYSSLTEEQAGLFVPGNVIEGPYAETSAFIGTSGGWVWFPWLDFGGPGSDFVIGSDVPPDVPCTRDCPPG